MDIRKVARVLRRMHIFEDEVYWLIYDIFDVAGRQISKSAMEDFVRTSPRPFENIMGDAYDSLYTTVKKTAVDSYITVATATEETYITVVIATEETFKVSAKEAAKKIAKKALEDIQPSFDVIKAIIGDDIYEKLREYSLELNIEPIVKTIKIMNDDVFGNLRKAVEAADNLMESYIDEHHKLYKATK